MNRKILEALGDDNLCINPTFYNGPPKYEEAIKVMYKTAETLEKKLNEEEKKIFDQFCDAQSDANHIYQVDRFVCGYRLGVLMMVEVFSGTSDFFLQEEAVYNKSPGTEKGESL